MPLQKQSLPINFAQGVDTKSDPWQLSFGSFLALWNMVFTKAKLLQKRNGFGLLPAPPASTTLTTFNNNLIAANPSLSALLQGDSQWVNQGKMQGVGLSTLPLVRTSSSQSVVDSAVASSVSLVCSGWTDAASNAFYQVQDSTTGQVITPPVALPSNTNSVRVFVLPTQFVVTYAVEITGSWHIQYIGVPFSNPNNPTAANDLSTNVNSSAQAYDGVVVNNTLFVAWSGGDGGGALRISFLTSSLAQGNTIVVAGYTPTLVSLTADTSGSAPIIWITFYDGTYVYSTAYSVVYSSGSSNFSLLLNFAVVRAATPAASLEALTSLATGGALTVLYEQSNTYTGTSTISDLLYKFTITPVGTTFTSVFSSGAGTITASSATGLSNGMHLVDNTTPANIAAGVTFTISGTTLTLSSNTAGNSASSPGDTLAAANVTAPAVLLRGVGLASKAFFVSGAPYVLIQYGSYNSGELQPTYFLTDLSGNIVSILASQNGGGYGNGGAALIVLPSVSVSGLTASVGYRYRDIVESQAPAAGAPPSTTANIYSQTGLNLATFDFTKRQLPTAEIANGLHFTGGFVWQYDGVKPVEHNFFLGPEDLWLSSTTSGGSLPANTQFWYIAVYQWTDGQGMIHNSAPSIAASVTTSSGSSNLNTINVPTLRLTYKTGSNPVRLALFRYSTAQPVFYQVSAPSATPKLNSTTADYVTFTDGATDATISGNPTLYTTGGVLDNGPAPACPVMTMFDSRVWVLDAEDRNLWRYSKQVIEGVPVEFAPNQTYYVAPSIGAEGSTGEVIAGAPMDDKFIHFKENALYYTTGTGPDATGNNNGYSDPIFITSAIGCVNQNSIVLTPNGLLFDTNKGRWLLGRDLSTNYLGAPVEAYNGYPVTSAVSVPGTNQIRVSLATNVTLMWDYYYNQWGFFNLPQALSSTIYNGLHTILTTLGQVIQETPGSYLDIANPVLMSFQTGWLNAAGLQGYERAYFFYLLGKYLSPHKLSVSIAYDYNPSPTQSLIISPNNYSPPWGSGASWGSNPVWGGNSNVEQWKIHLQRQTAQAFQITVSEIFDPSFGTVAGPGLTLSGINCVLGLKKPYRPQPAAVSTG